MARISIEDEFTSDPRFTRLCALVGCEPTAIGMMIILWRFAQKYWFKRELIPFHAWSGAGFSEHILTCGLAEKRDDGIYVRGSHEHFSWYFEKTEAGRKGGRISAQRERDSKGRLLPQKDPSTIQAQSKQTPSESNPLTLDITLTTTKEEYIVDFDFDAIWNDYPNKDGRKKALKHFSSSVKTEEDYENIKKALINYKRKLLDNEWLKPKNGSTWFNNWQDFIDYKSETVNIEELEKKLTEKYPLWS